MAAPFMVHGLNLILENAECNKIAGQIQEGKLLFPDNLAKTGRHVEHIRPISAMGNAQPGGTCADKHHPTNKPI
jgi:hypothetical protein